jgi:hypothetical protein
VTALAIIVACFAAAQPDVPDDFEFAGVRLGMSKPELTRLGAIWRDTEVGTIPHFTVGGVTSRRDGLRIELDNGQLVMVAFAFRATDFPVLLKLVSAQFPDLLCTSLADVGLDDGATVAQRTCTLSTQYGQLRLSRYANDAETGFLGIASTDWMQRYGGRQLAQ